MKKLLLSTVFALVTGITFAQSPKWTKPSSTDSVETAILVTLNQFVKGISTHNVDLLRAAELPEGGGITIAIENADGTHQIVHQDWEKANARVAAMPPNYDDAVYDHKITIDSDLAFVWARYTVSINGKPHACGIEHYSLARKNGVWKIVENAWTSHTNGCEIPKG